MSRVADTDAAKRELLALLSREPLTARPEADHPFAASVVRLHARGDKRPFFCVHPGSGAVGCFAEIAPLVDPDRPFVGLQAPGVDGEREPIESMVELARGYVDEVRKVQPHGPYFLGGWSMGGTIAFQMAHELRRLGEEVALLVLFDTQRAEALHTARLPRETAIMVAYQQAALATEHLARQRGVVLDRAHVFERFVRDRPRAMPARVALMMELLVEHGVFHDHTAPLFRVFLANMRALGDYGMPDEPYDRTITLFRCGNDILGEAFQKVDLTYEWSRSTSRPVDVVTMPSHHFALFHGVVLPITAERLRRCLDAADPG